MMKYYVADAFTNRIFEGNTAGVCVMSDWPSEEKMSRDVFLLTEGMVYKQSYSIVNSDEYTPMK